MTEPRHEPTGDPADPARPAGASPAPRPEAVAPRNEDIDTAVSPVAERTTDVHPLPERQRDDTVPGTTRGEHLPTAPATGPTTERTTERTTWHPEADPARRDPDRTDPAWSTRPVAVRRPDPVAAFALLLAGIAAGISLLVPWTPDGRTGLGLLQDGLDQLGSDWTGVFDGGLWQPLAVLFGGGVLFVLGLLLLVPAKAHRFLGVLALLVALVVVAAVLVPLADVGWDLTRFDVGFFFALGVAGLGLLGALKATVTGRKVS